MTDVSAMPPELVARIEELSKDGDLQLPPPIFLDMGGQFLDLDMAEKSLAVRFPVQARYQNPMGYMQGGMIAAAIDNVIGPLSFLVAPPSVTKSLEIVYRRPIPPSIKEITVVARLVTQDGRELLFAAEVWRGKGTVLAKATSRNVIMRRKGG